MFGQRNDVYLNLHLRLTRPLAHQELALEETITNTFLSRKKFLRTISILTLRNTPNDHQNPANLRTKVSGGRGGTHRLDESPVMGLRGRRHFSETNASKRRGKQ